MVLISALLIGVSHVLIRVGLFLKKISMSLLLITQKEENE